MSAANEAFGLVPSSTSDRKDELSIDRFESRYRRMLNNIITSILLLKYSKVKGGIRFFLAMLTLTYAEGVDWMPHHVPELQKRIRG